MTRETKTCHPQKLARSLLSNSCDTDANAKEVPVNNFWTHFRSFTEMFKYVTFVMADTKFNLLSSGTYFPLIVLSDGQKMPTQVSNSKNPVNITNWF